MEIIKAAIAQLVPHLADALVTVVLALITLIAARLSAYLREAGKGERLASAMLRLNDAVGTAVREIEQTVRPLVVAAAADGRITPEEAAQLKDAAMASARRYMGAHVGADLKKILGVTEDDFDRLLDAKVEAAVHDLRLRTKVANVQPMVTFGP